MNRAYHIFILLLILLLQFPTQIFATSSVISIVSISPDRIKIGQSGIISFSVSLPAKTDWYMKVVGGDNPEKSETYNPETKKWLPYTGGGYSWVDFPKISNSTDSVFVQEGNITYRIKTGSTLGQSQIAIRLAKISNTSTQENSETKEITIISADPTPSPTAVSTPNPTNIPSNTPVPTNFPSPSVTPRSSSDYDNISLTEIYPSPEVGSNEWIEIFNGNDGAANLNGWYIQDNAGTYKELKDFSIGGKSYAYFAFGSGYLNNMGDTVTLLNSDKKLKSSLPAAYPGLTSTQSWAKVNDDWCVSTPSKGEVNSQCIAEDSNIISKPSMTAVPKNIPSPTTNIISKKELKESSDSAQSMRQLPILGVQDETALSEATKSSNLKKPLPKLLLPMGIAGSGLMLLGGSLTALTKPELITAIIRTITRR